MSKSNQNGLIVIAEIIVLCEQKLKQKLQQLDALIDITSDNPFSTIKNLHFARFVILPAGIGRKKKAIPLQLLYSCSYDGSLDKHLDEIIKSEMARWFHEIFSCCKDYDVSKLPAEAVKTFIKQQSKPTNAFYRGYPKLPASLINGEQEIYVRIQQVLNLINVAELKPQEIKEIIYGNVVKAFPGCVEEASKLEQAKNFPINDKLLLATPFVLLLILLWVTYLISCFAFIIFSLWLLSIPVRLHMREVKDRERARQFNNQPVVSSLIAKEDKITQNQLTHLVPVSAGHFRRNFLRTVLFGINFIARYKFIHGNLADISSIHFAGWTLIDKGRRLLFLSNFDGSWENYLSDFVDRASTGLTAIWSNTVDFPETSRLIFDGAADEEKFKKWARTYQITTQVWYSAHHNLSVKNIWRNHRIVSGLGRTMDNDKQISEWLKLL